jgi:hypothetical protein
MKSTNKPLVKSLYSIAIMGAIFFVIHLSSQKENREIKEDLIITNGTVYDSRMAHKGGVNIFYYFFVDGKHIKQTKTLSISSSFRSIFLNRTFPVVYSSKNPELNRMLVLKSDFKRFEIPFPDSLKFLNEMIVK